MRKLLPLLAALVALAAMPLLAATALANHHPKLDEIALPNGWQPEGIAAGRGSTAYVGSLADGGIARVNLKTGEVDADFVESATGPAVGLEYEDRNNGHHRWKGHGRGGDGDRDWHRSWNRDRLWVAGGPSGEIRVYGARSGKLLETYTFDAGFINDLVVTRRAVYATDSLTQQLLVVPLGRWGRLPDPERAFEKPIKGDLVYEDGFNANGIEAVFGWLIVAQSNTGELFVVNPKSGRSHEILPEGSIDNADGILLVGRKLYVVQNALNQITVWRLGWDGPELVQTITDDDVPGDFDFPTTAAKARGSLWAVNARFSTEPMADTAYWITRVPIH
jgi:hypothetical protein